MKRYTFPVAVFFRWLAARLHRARRAREGAAAARGAGRLLVVAFVVLAVLAASLVFSGSSSAHDVVPEYSCDEGEPDEDNECTATEDAEAVYSCDDDDGVVVGDQCEVPTGVDAVAECPSGSRLDGSECLHTADPTYSCGSSERLVGNRCVHTVAPADRCPSGGTLSGNVCVHTADPTYSCGSSERLVGNRCVHTVAPADRCPSGGTLSGNVCVHTADPTYSCGSSGTLVGNRCVHTVAPADRCPSGGTLSGNVCLHTANPSYSCSSGTLSGSRCLHTTSPDYSCSSGTLRGTRCVSTQPPVCTRNNNFVPCDTPGVTRHCSPGYALSGGQCTRSTAATASCPAGYQTGAFGICYRYTTASTDCPAGFPPPSGGLCLKRTTSAPPCSTGYTLTGGQCTRSTLAASECPSGYDPPSQGICYKRTTSAPPCSTGYTLTGGQCTRSTLAASECPAGFPPPSGGLCLKRTTSAPPCSTGYTLTGGQCTRSTLAASECPAGYDPPSQGICYKRTPPQYTCTPGTPNDDNQCVTTKPATLTHTCPDDESPDQNNQCTTTTPADPTCPEGTWDGTTCAHTHTGPTIEDLDATGTAKVGGTYQDPFSVLGTNSAATVAESACSLAEDAALRVGTTRHYTLSATATQPGEVVCTVTADTATQTATITFAAVSISGLPSADDGPVGKTYRRNFSVLGTNRAATVAESGCSVAEDTALRVGTTRHYTLSASRSGPGEVVCTITADTASHKITIAFNPITIEGLDATGTAKVGATYQDPFSVLGTNRAATVAESGCSVVEDTALRAGTTRHYTLSATATQPGKVVCTVTANTVTQTATITFTAPPPPPATLEAPSGLGCTWQTEGDERVECTWDAVTGATGGYHVKYELSYSIRGRAGKLSRERTVSGTEFSVGVNSYITAAKFQVAAKGPDNTGPYASWATASSPPTVSPLALEGLECRTLFAAYDPRGREYAEQDKRDWLAGKRGCVDADCSTIVWTIVEDKWNGSQDCTTSEPLEYLGVDLSDRNGDWGNLIFDFISLIIPTKTATAIDSLLYGPYSSVPQLHTNPPFYTTIIPPKCVILEVYSSSFGTYEAYRVAPGDWSPRNYIRETTSYDVSGMYNNKPYTITKNLTRFGQTCVPVITGGGQTVG